VNRYSEQSINCGIVKYIINIQYILFAYITITWRVHSSLENEEREDGELKFVFG
jgi:hypothetical protein